MLGESSQTPEGLTMWCFSPAKLSCVLGLLSYTFYLAAFFLLVYLEENRVWLLHPLLQPTQGSCWGGWRTWVARGVSTSSILGWDPPWWDAVDYVSLPSSLPGFSAQGSWPQPWLFFMENKALFIFLFFFFPLELAVGKELETICTRKYMLKNDCVSPSPLGTTTCAAEMRQQCVRRPVNCHWRKNE